jgi:hypothetical protein
MIDAQPPMIMNRDSRIIWRVYIRSYHAPRRRVIAALKQGVIVLLVMIALASSCSGEKASSPLKMQEVEKYRQIAHRIIDHIVALKDRYPHLTSIDNTAHKEEAREKLWIAYHYTHGMSWIPNPNYNPLKKGSRRLKSFSAKDGIELNLYFYEGEWMGQAAVRPLHIGAMNIVTLIEGSDTPSVEALRRDVARIVADEMNRFKLVTTGSIFLPGVIFCGNPAVKKPLTAAACSFVHNSNPHS